MVDICLIQISQLTCQLCELTVADWLLCLGLMPRDKPKGQTVRDVKRQSEQRKEREKQYRREDEEFSEGEF